MKEKKEKIFPAGIIDERKRHSDKVRLGSSHYRDAFDYMNTGCIGYKLLAAYSINNDKSFDE